LQHRVKSFHFLQTPMEETPANSELHELFDGRLKLYQPARGYRFSIDALLLAAFARGRCAGAVADLGTGCGVLPVLLARRDEVTRITAVEIQQELAGLARRNSVLNGCAEKISVLCGDLRAIRKMAAPESFDSVVTNPPFYPAASGRINPMAQKAAARHEVHGSLDDFIAAGSYLLKRGGRYMLIYSATRLADLLVAMRKKSLEPKTFQFVHARSDEPATMVLAEAVKGAGAEAKIEPPIMLYESQGVYSGQAQELFASL
jgi:tRNA1Val (adenine37-N6)-methyltransferase